ncbi:Crp/Fnr family transcriptional regulator [Treponema zuelzerae]|uniref:Crp/Fnr family transcriptional regulator n=1 Tax=Teretinema zuelzerae TaxID=156 RepID=A0AAE3EHM8_9SPIR|nr:Crp/Fnr family transcriptional regulator [Teretinema zuelzerae]MBN2810759.1 Crp/Fnr family transcriptional regulator [Spirochaetales bacterium]MCD1654390.1 Crp/Fnr family transcriptional regulator [Teretinema zuelzerae]
MALMDDTQTAFPLDIYLSPEDKSMVHSHLRVADIPAGTVLFDSTSCKGVIVVVSGVVRVYILSDGGREITLYRLFANDLCTLSVSCVMGSMPMQAMIQTDTDCRITTLSNDIFSDIHSRYPSIQKLMLETMNSRLSDIMWVLEQVAFKAMDVRIAQYLLSRPSLIVYSTHDEIAAELGTAREVVSRMLKYFEKNGYVELSRGKIKIIDERGFRKILEKSE